MLSKNTIIFTNLKVKKFLRTTVIYLILEPSQRFLQVQPSSKFQLQQQTPRIQKLSIVQEKESQNTDKQNQKGNMKQIQNNLKQLSMDPQSLLFRNMMIQKTKNEDKTLHQRIYLMVEEHRLQDLKEILKLETSLDVNYQNNYGDTMLISASKCGAAQIVEYLLKNGADVSIQNHNGQTAMDVALKYYQFQTADIIFKYLQPDIDEITYFKSVFFLIYFG